VSKKIGIRPCVDFAFRKIFGKPGNEICLIHLLNSVLNLAHPIDSVQFQNPFSLKDFQEDKLVCVDVKATDAAGRVFVVEIQIVVHASFAKRALFYACSAYTDQLRKGQGYGQLKPTYCVSVLMRKLWDDDQLHHHYRLVERTTGGIMPESIEIHTIELSKYNGVRESIHCASELEQWCYWLKNADLHTEDELRELLPGLAFLRATSELQEIHDITEERQMYDSREKASMDYESNLIDAKEKGEAIGIEKGEAIGIEKGEAIGIEKGEAIGIEKGEAIGLAKGIQLLQELLETPVVGLEKLSKMSVNELAMTLKSLQAKLRDRNK
jgi:predicted transposase/invertase (TIGR01784 family)